MCLQSALAAAEQAVKETTATLKVVLEGTVALTPLTGFLLLHWQVL
jgi:hypothetical protein